MGNEYRHRSVKLCGWEMKDVGLWLILADKCGRLAAKNV